MTQFPRGRKLLSLENRREEIKKVADPAEGAGADCGTRAARGATCSAKSADAHSADDAQSAARESKRRSSDAAD